MESYNDYNYIEYDMSEVERTYKAESEKTKGNEFFKSGEYEDAFLCYTRSIILDDMITATYSNRAIVNLKLNKLELAESDCNRALELETTSSSDATAAATAAATASGIDNKTVVKILTRRGMTRIRLGKYAEVSNKT